MKSKIMRKALFGIAKRVRNYGPLMLGGASAAGVFLTAYTSVKNDRKAPEKKINFVAKFEKEPTKDEHALNILPSYIPAVVCGTLTTGCLIASTYISRKQVISLTSAYVALDQYHRRYTNKVIARDGIKADRDIRKEII